MRAVRHRYYIAEEELILRVVIPAYWLGRIRAPSCAKRDYRPSVVTFGSHRTVEVEVLVLKHRGGVPAADTKGQHGRRLELEAHTAFRRTEVVLELEFVYSGLDDESGLSIRHVLTPIARCTSRVRSPPRTITKVPSDLGRRRTAGGSGTNSPQLLGPSSEAPACGRC